MLRVIQHIYMIPLIVSALIGIKGFRLNWPVPYKIFSLLLIFISVVEISAISWKYYFHDLGGWHFSNSNIWLYNISVVPQYLLYMAIYYRIINSPLIKRAIITLAILLSSFSIINWIYFQSIYSINSNTLLLASSIMIFLTITYFDQLRKEKEILKLTAQPMVWISLGALIYHSANLPYIISLNYLIRSNVSLAVALFYIYLALNCVMYVCYTIAFLCQPHPPK